MCGILVQRVFEFRKISMETQPVRLKARVCFFQLVHHSRPYAGIFSGGGGGQDYLQYTLRARAGGGCGRGVPHEGAFAFLRLKLKRSGAYFGWIFWKIEI